MLSSYLYTLNRQNLKTKIAWFTYEHFLLTSAKLDLPKETSTRKTSFQSSQINKYKKILSETKQKFGILLFKCCLYVSEITRKLAQQLPFLEGNKNFFTVSPKEKKTCFYMATTNFVETRKDLFFSQRVFSSKKIFSGGRWFTRNSYWKKLFFQKYLDTFVMFFSFFYFCTPRTLKSEIPFESDRNIKNKIFYLPRISIFWSTSRFPLSYDITWVKRNKISFCLVNSQKKFLGLDFVFGQTCRHWTI